MRGVAVSFTTTTLCAFSLMVAGTAAAVSAPPLTAAPAARPSSVPKAAVRAIPTRASAVRGSPVRAIVPDGPPPAILPLSEVRPGMEGEALTVFQGTKPEPFKVRVVSVMRQFLPRQDIILIRAEDPRVAFTGIVAGMSGSPVYIDGRLMGAIAYAWSFSKEPLCGVTPIETMLAERERPRRSNAQLVIETRPDGMRLLTAAEGGPSQGGFHTGFQRQPALGSTSAATATATATATEPTNAMGEATRAEAGDGPGRSPREGQAGLIPVAVPLSVSGFDARALAGFSDEFRSVGLVPVQAGGGRRLQVAGGAGRVEPGSAIGVEMVRGDMSMVGTGTVTYVDRDVVLAFGHPLFGAGEIYLPLVDSEIHAILPSLSQSMKLSSPLREVGALVQDRQSCIVGDLNARATMIPINVRVTAPGTAPRIFHAEVARNRRLTPMLAALVATNAILNAEPDAADMVVSVVSTVNLKGRAPFALRDEMFSPEGVSRLGLAGTRGLRAVGELLSNPFEPVVLNGLDIEVSIDYRRDITEIVGLSLPGDVVRPGQTVPLRVTLRPYAGPEYVETIPVVIPRVLGGDVARIEASSGASARPDMAQAETLRTYVDNLGKYYSPSAIVISVQTPDDGAALHGRLLPDLPSVAADTLRPGNQTRRADAYRVAQRTVFPTQRLVFGKQDISVYVRDDPEGEAPRAAR